MRQHSSPGMEVATQPTLWILYIVTLTSQKDSMDMRYRPKARDRKKSLNVEADSCSRKIIWEHCTKTPRCHLLIALQASLLPRASMGHCWSNVIPLGDPMKSWVYLSFKFIWSCYLLNKFGVLLQMLFERSCAQVLADQSGETDHLGKFRI